MTWFTRAATRARSLRRRRTIYPATWWPGTWAADVLHIGIVSDRKAVTGTPLVIHNIGAGTREEDILFRFAIIGHYRL